MRPIRRQRPATVPAAGDGGSSEADLLAELVSRSSGGDEAAFSVLYDRLAPLVYGIACRVVRDEVQSQEVTQEVFLELWRLAPRFDPVRGSVRSWAAVMAHRRSVDRVRAEQASRQRDERDARLRAAGLDLATDEVDERIERDRVRRALEALTDVQRQAIELAYFGGYTYREVAALLGAPEGTIKTRIRDSMILLRNELGVAT